MHPRQETHAVSTRDWDEDNAAGDAHDSAGHGVDRTDVGRTDR